MSLYSACTDTIPPIESKEGDILSTSHTVWLVTELTAEKIRIIQEYHENSNAPLYQLASNIGQVVDETNTPTGNYMQVLLLGTILWDKNPSRIWVQVRDIRIQEVIRWGQKHTEYYIQKERKKRS